MPFVTSADGLQIYAEAFGEGIPVLLSCGLCTTHVNFRPQVAPLVAAGFRPVLWDYRGHGRSDAPEDASYYDLDRVLDDLARVLDWAAPGEPAVLGGLSFGGLASLHFALRKPERVRALLLFGSGPGFKNPSAAAAWQAQCDRTASFIQERGLAAFVAGKAGRTAVGLRPELPQARAAREAIVRQNPVALGLFSSRIGGPAPPVIDALAELDVPALVLVGERDEPYLRAADVMEARLPQGEKVVLPGAGHISNLEETQAFDRAVLAFLQRLPADPPQGG